MFTCSSCGYEANPDSAPACSLCGTKKPGAGGTPKAMPRPAPAKATDDELANAAKAVAAEAEKPAPAAAKSSTKSKPAPKGARGAVATETSTGILKLKHEPAHVDNASMVLGAFVGTLVGYVVAWHQVHGAPAFLDWILFVLGGAVVFGLLGRFVLGRMLEEQLSAEARETFSGPIAMLVGAGFVVFTCFAFFEGGASTSTTQTDVGASGAVGTDGRALAEHLALLTPWSLKVKTASYISLVNAGTEAQIPVHKLTADDVKDLQKKLGLSAPELERWTSDDPMSGNLTLPSTFSIDRFLEQLASVYGVQRVPPPENPSRSTMGVIKLTRRKSDGSEETLQIAERVATTGDLVPALPQGIKLWIGVALGLPAKNAGADQDQFTDEVFAKYTPQN